MKQRDILKGKVYIGRDGEERQVESIECSLQTDYRVRVVWVANSVKWGNCELKHFARWAQKEVA